MGTLAKDQKIDEKTTPPLVAPPVRSFTDLLKQREEQRADEDLSVDGIGFPTSSEEGKLDAAEVGPYNPVSLAGRALSLSASLSPDYLQAYLAGLEDLSALRTLPEPSRRRR